MAQNNQNYCTIYVVRHGQTDSNLNHKIQGHSETSLNERGKLQAQMVSKKLKSIKFDAVFSSDLLRTRQTAEIITLGRELALKTTQALRERRYGKLEGQSFDVLSKIDEYKRSLSREKRIAYKPYPDVESDEELITRVITFLRELAVGYAGKTILVVSHGGVMRALLNHLGKETPHLAVPNGAYIKLESDGVDFFVKETEGIKFDEQV